MLTPKENLLETLKKDGKPECLCNSFTMFRGIAGDPCFQLIRGNRIRGTNSYDAWGTYIMFPEDAPAAVPMVTPENQVIQDITEWKKYVKVPDLRAKCSTGWEKAIANKNAIDSDKYLSMVVMGTGIFEQLHMLMTFEDTLMNFLLEPEAMHELIDAICDYRLTYMQLVVENLHPDCIVSHDDWGSKDSLFWSPDTWREFFKEPYRKLYKYLKEQNVIVMHHADSYCEPLVEDMAEIGVDIWQGVLPTNNIKAISEKVGDKMLLMGGIDSVIDREDASEEEIRKEARRACEEYGHLKGFWPGITYGGPGTIYPQVEGIVIDEINRYNQERFGVAIS
jgi:hypothetical protein